MLTQSKNARYNANDKMANIISDNYQLIQVMSRFGIPVGFGDKTVEETCRINGVDCNTFLTVVNFVMDGFAIYDSAPDVSLESLLHYLRQSHIYFIEYFLPEIRRKLIEGISLRSDDVSFLILKFFDEYLREVRTHMEYEEKTVFKYVRSLIDGSDCTDYKITTYSDHHEQVNLKLKELKSLIIRYCPEPSDTNTLNDALYNIYRCEEELKSHCQVEDCLLVPAIMQLERSRLKDNL